MLKKILRLSRKDLEAFFSTGGGSAFGGKKRPKFTTGKLVSLRFNENNLKHSRFAFIVSFEDKQKRKGRAVIRNLLRRRMSEIVRNSVKNIKPGLDMVFFIKIKNQKQPKYRALTEDIQYVLSKSYL